MANTSKKARRDSVNTTDQQNVSEMAEIEQALDVACNLLETNRLEELNDFLSTILARFPHIWAAPLQKLKSCLFSENPTKSSVAFIMVNKLLKGRVFMQTWLDESDVKMCFDLVKFFLSRPNEYNKQMILNTILRSHFALKNTKNNLYETIVHVFNDFHITFPSLENVPVSSQCNQCSVCKEVLLLNKLILTCCQKCFRTLCDNCSMPQFDLYGSKFLVCLMCSKLFADKNINENFKKLVSTEILRTKTFLGFSDLPPDKSNDTLRTFYEADAFVDVEVFDVTKTFKKGAHRLLLAAKSSFFKEKLTDPNVKKVELDIEKSVLIDILDFIYKDHVENLKDKADKLLNAADKLGLERLQAMCAKTLFEQMNVSNAIKIFISAKISNTYILKKAVTRFIIANKDTICKGMEWRSFCSNHSELLYDIFRGFVKDLLKSPTDDRDVSQCQISKNDVPENMHLSAEKMKNLFEDNLFCDYVIQVEGRDIRVHKNILYYCGSSYFSKILHQDADGNSKCLLKMEGKYNVVYEMLRFIYTGNICNMESIVFDLLVVADRYNIIQLKNLCENHIIDKINNNKIVKADFTKILTAAHVGNSKDLKRFAFQKIKRNIQFFLKRQEFFELAINQPHLTSELMESWSEI